MFKEIKVKACFGERTGYQIHASRFFPELQALMPSVPSGNGTVHISLLDTVTASQTTERLPYPSILYNVWESSEQPLEFINKLNLYDQLWVPSEWQKSVSIAQGIKEEFIKVVPEGVDPEIYKPLDGKPNTTMGKTHPLDNYPFVFVHVGQWQHRKSTLEIIKAFLKAFPSLVEQSRDNPLGQGYCNVRLELSVDTLFPSDPYKSTEERLKAYGIDDPRISVVHFEERADYIRRLQSAHCFISCSRSEGWGLPIIEAAACGIPTTVADWGGSTEYAGELINVRIKELKKPEGIYGGWDVPGMWAEPDYDHLAECLRDVYENYAKHKAKALETSEMIRTKFSWKAAAKKAFTILEELSVRISFMPDETKESSVEADIIAYAKKRGYDIEIKKRNAIFVIDSHPSSQERIDTLIESINQVKSFGYPVLVVTHLPLPESVVKLADYHIYDKKDVLSGEDKPVYSRTIDGTTERVVSSIPCHAVAWLHNFRNAVDFCKGKYEWIYNMSSDVECDLKFWLDKVHASDKDFIATRWEGGGETISGQLIAAKITLLDKVFTRIETWEEFAEKMGGDRFCCEKGYYKIAKEKIGLENIDFIEMELGNRFDQIDREAWEDDLFQYHFVEGPFLNIDGLSKREYDVEFTTPTGKGNYKLKQARGMWSRPALKYCMPWTITAKLNGEEKFRHTFDPKGKRILISLGSKALGDTIAWMPYIEEFRKKNECHVLCSGWWQEMFDYPEIEFVKPGALADNIYATFGVGCYDDQLNLNVKNWRETNLQQVAADILGLEYKPLRAKLKYTPHKVGNGSPPRPYICFSEHSTMKNKLWNREGAWQKVIDYVAKKGMSAISISNEKSSFKRVIDHCNQSIQKSIADIAGCEFYIGLNAGPSWIAYALGKPVIMVTGVSEEWNDFPNPNRIAINHDVCGVGCFNDPSLPMSRDWEWCPRNKDYACTKLITEEMVYEKINLILGDVKLDKHLKQVFKDAKEMRV